MIEYKYSFFNLFKKNVWCRFLHSRCYPATWHQHWHCEKCFPCILWTDGVMHR